MGGFSEEERKWIVLNFREDIGVTQLRRSFMTKMRPKSPRTKPSLQCFKKILEKFKETGSVQDLRKGNHRPTLSGDTVSKVKTHFLIHQSETQVVILDFLIQVFKKP